MKKTLINYITFLYFSCTTITGGLPYYHAILNNKADYVSTLYFGSFIVLMLAMSYSLRHILINYDKK